MPPPTSTDLSVMYRWVCPALTRAVWRLSSVCLAQSPHRPGGSRGCWRVRRWRQPRPCPARLPGRAPASAGTTLSAAWRQPEGNQARQMPRPRGIKFPRPAGAVMLNRTAVSAAPTGLALTGALCACGSATQHSGPAGAGAGTPSAATAPAGPSSPGRPRRAGAGPRRRPPQRRSSSRSGPVPASSPARCGYHPASTSS